MTWRGYIQGDVVFNYGELGFEYFVIIRGRVQVLVPTSVQFASRDQYIESMADNYENIVWKTVDNIEDIKFSVRSLIKERQDRRRGGHEEEIPNKQSKDNGEGAYRYSYLKEVAVFGKGQSFGELALTTDGIRSATIVCLDTPTDFAIMNK